MEEGILKGDTCNRKECKGVINEHSTGGGCSCHIHAPCGYCETPREYCPVCDWDANDEMQEVDNKNTITYSHPKPKSIQQIHKELDERYAQDDGKLYKIIRYFDSVREGVQASNMKKGDALRFLDNLLNKPRYYVSYTLKEQSDK